MTTRSKVKLPNIRKTPKRTAYERDRLKVSKAPTIGDLDRIVDSFPKIKKLVSSLTKTAGELDAVKRQIYYTKDPEGSNGSTLVEDEQNLRYIRFMHGFLGIASELAECHAGFTKDGELKPMENPLEELGDIRWYLGEMIDAFGLTMKQVEDANIAKLAKRYPGLNFSSEAAQEENRDREAEKAELEKAV